jgi:hypothetical protein
MYDLALFVHLLGVALLIAAVTTALVATLRAQTASTVQELRAVTAVTRKIDVVIGPAMLLILAGGLYMVARGGDDGGISWTSGWVIVALVIFAVMSALGPVFEAGHAKRLLAAAGQTPDGPVPAELDRLRRNPTALYVSFFGASQILAFLYLMTNKPGLAGSLVACAIAAVVSAVAASRRLRSLSTRPSGPTSTVSGAHVDPGVAPTA